jgi:hypothetical protein
MESEIQRFCAIPVRVFDCKIHSDAVTARRNQEDFARCGLPEKVSAQLEVISSRANALVLALIDPTGSSQELVIHTCANTAYDGTDLQTALAEHSRAIILGGNAWNTAQYLADACGDKELMSGLSVTIRGSGADRTGVHISTGGTTQKIASPFPNNLSFYLPHKAAIKRSDISLLEANPGEVFGETGDPNLSQYAFNFTTSRRKDGGGIAATSTGRAPIISHNIDEASIFLGGAVDALSLERWYTPSKNPLREDLEPFHHETLHPSIVHLLQYYAALHSRLMYSGSRAQSQRFDLSTSLGAQGGALRMYEHLFYASIPTPEAMGRLLNPIQNIYPDRTHSNIHDSAATGDRMMAIQLMANAMSVPNTPAIQSEGMGKWLRQFMNSKHPIQNERFMNLAEGIFWSALQQVQAGIVYHSSVNDSSHIWGDYEKYLYSTVARDAITAALHIYSQDGQSSEQICAYLPNAGISVAVFKQTCDIPSLPSVAIVNAAVRAAMQRRMEQDEGCPSHRLANVFA